MIEWKDVPGYEGFYKVSNTGLVKSLERSVNLRETNNHAENRLKERIRHFSTGRRGYKQVVLSRDGKTKAFLVHRLVAVVFIPNPENLPVINHKDGDPSNNNVENLEWCTYKYNNEYDNRIDRCREKIRNTLKRRYQKKSEEVDHNGR